MEDLSKYSDTVEKRAAGTGQTKYLNTHTHTKKEKKRIEFGVKRSTFSDGAGVVMTACGDQRCCICN